MNENRWTMDVVLACEVTPPPDVLRQAIEDLAAQEPRPHDEDGRTVVTLEAYAPDGEAAVEALNRNAHELAGRLSRYTCTIERIDKLEKPGVAEQPQGGSLLP
jgi:hypothetical protein